MKFDKSNTFIKPYMHVSKYQPTSMLLHGMNILSIPH